VGLLEHQDPRLLRSVVREFALRSVAPLARRIDSENYYPRDLVREMGRMGILAPNVPEDLGGAGLDLTGVSIVLEEIARFSGSAALIPEVQGTLVAHILVNYGGKAIRDDVIPRLASGDSIGSFALSEPCCGSDAANIETTIERQGGEWVVKGTKMWITQAMYADYFLVFGRIGSRGERHRNIAAILLRRGSCIKTNPIEVMGFRGTGTAEVIIDNCRAGDDDLIAPPPHGFKAAMDALNIGRVAISALGLGLAEAAFEEAYIFLSQRTAFGKPIIEFQGIQFTLAELYAMIESARALTYRAAELYRENQGDFPAVAAVTKLHTAKVSVTVAGEALRLLGGYGYSKESNVERIYRDSKLLEIGEGTNEIQKMVIFKHLRKGPSWFPAP
jgi:alkylation response protein AidB-like acyl-CoA dehydrogenase